MKELTKNVRRRVRIRASDPAIDDGEFVLGFGPDGLSVRRAGASVKTGRQVSWRSIVGFVLIHGGK